MSGAAPASNGPSAGSDASSAPSVLVTGAAGFIGSHLCDRLLREGNHVWGLDNFDDFYDPNRKWQNLAAALREPNMHLVEGDVRDEILLDGLMSDVEFDAVVHLAALPGVEASIENPDLCFDVNVRGTLRLLEAIRRHSVPGLLFASSVAVYGAEAELPLSESVPADRPLSPFAAAKRAGEMLCHSHHHLYGLDVCCLRLFDVYGPRQRPDLVIQRLADDLAAGDPPVLYGDEGSGRDYTYIDDVVDGIVLALHLARSRNGAEASFEIINVGRGESVELDELAEELSELMGISSTITYHRSRAGQSGATLASTEKGTDVLGYEPRVELKDGLARFVTWHRENDLDIEANAKGGTPEHREETSA